MRINRFSPARWALAFFAPTLPVICAAALYTYLVDPLWQWPHPHHLERWHRSFNERLQKTNYLASRDVNIDTLILGSSVSSYFRPSWLGTENGFSYVANNGYTSEFAAYIEYAKERSSIPLKLVMIEASTRNMFEREIDREEPSYYIENAESSAKKIRSLFSLSALGYALQSRKTPKHDYYFVDRFGQPSECRYPVREFANAEEKQISIEKNLESYIKDIYSHPYIEGFSQYLADIRKAAGDAELIIYTPPVSRRLMKAFAEMGLLEGYEAASASL